MDFSVLLVDDDERISQALGLALADEGFDVDEAISGEDALSRFDNDSFDVVLLDLTLPGVDGLQVCRTLRAQGDLPITIVTARTDTPDVIAGLEACADYYVTKPLVASELAARIRAAATARRSETEPLVSHRGPGNLAGRRRCPPRWRGNPAHPHRVPPARRTGRGGRRIVTREQLLQRVWGTAGHANDVRTSPDTGGDAATPFAAAIEFGHAINVDGSDTHTGEQSSATRQVHSASIRTGWKIRRKNLVLTRSRSMPADAEAIFDVVSDLDNMTSWLPDSVEVELSGPNLVRLWFPGRHTDLDLERKIAIDCERLHITWGQRHHRQLHRHA